MKGFARALEAVGGVGTFGAVKYTPFGWIEVPNGQERYDDAMWRHWISNAKGEEVDSESELAHLAHLAWNALATLELKIRQEESNNG
jgi:hypothetical protein